MLESILLRDSKDQGIYWLVDSSLCYAVRLLKQSVVSTLESLRSKDTLIEIDDTVLMELQSPYLVFDFLAPVLVLDLLVRVDELDFLDALTLDLVNTVYLP